MCGGPLFDWPLTIDCAPSEFKGEHTGRASRGGGVSASYRSSENGRESSEITEKLLSGRIFRGVGMGDNGRCSYLGLFF